jgi:hypothetical protein
VKKAFFLILFIFISSLRGSEMVHAFKSPFFNGVNYSGHALTVENLARTRKQAVKDNLKADLEQKKIQETNTPLNTFINNLQARIYSQLASQVTDQIFNSNGETFGIINLQGGATVTWQKNGDLVTLYINDPATGSSTQIQLPVGVLKPGGG